MTIAQAERLESQAATILEEATAAARASGRLTDHRYSLLSTPESAALLAEAYQIRRELSQADAADEDPVVPPAAKAVPPALQAAIGTTPQNAPAPSAKEPNTIPSKAVQPTKTTAAKATRVEDEEEDRLVASILGIPVADLSTTAASLREARFVKQSQETADTTEADALVAKILAATSNARR